MSTWPNRGRPPAAPAGGWTTENPKTQATNLTIRPTGSDSSQQASSKPGVIQCGVVAGAELAPPGGSAHAEPVGGLVAGTLVARALSTKVSSSTGS